MMNKGKDKRVVIVLVGKRNNGGEDGMGETVKTMMPNKIRQQRYSTKLKYRCRK